MDVMQMIKDREPLTVMVGLTDLWALQKAIKYNTVMLDHRIGQPMFPATPVDYPSGVVYIHTAWKLRSKVNSLILRFVQEEIEDKLLALPLDYDEAWYIDSVISIESYGTARLFLVQIMEVIWEHEMGLPLKTDTMNKEMTGADGTFNPQDLIEFVSGKNSEEVDRDKEEEPPLTSV